MRTDALDIVQETLAALQEGTDLPDHCRAWLRDGLRTFLLEGVEMNAALEVKPGPGQATLPNQYRVAVRNYHIRSAAEHCAAETTWGRSMELANAVDRFASGDWDSAKHDAQPSATLAPLQQKLFLAFRAANGDIPATARQIVNMIRKPMETKPMDFFSESTGVMCSLRDNEKE